MALLHQPTPWLMIGFMWIHKIKLKVKIKTETIGNISLIFGVCRSSHTSVIAIPLAHYKEPHFNHTIAFFGQGLVRIILILFNDFDMQLRDGWRRQSQRNRPPEATGPGRFRRLVAGLRLVADARRQNGDADLRGRRKRLSTQSDHFVNENFPTGHGEAPILKSLLSTIWLSLTH